MSTENHVTSSSPPSTTTTTDDDNPLTDVKEIRLPSTLFRKTVGVSFDLGGTRSKLAFRKKKSAADTNDEDDKVTIVLAICPNSRFDDALEFIKNTGDLGDDKATERRVLRATGISLNKQRIDVIERQLNVKVQICDEFSLLANAVWHLVHHCPRDVIFEPDSEYAVKRIAAMMERVATLFSTLKSNGEKSESGAQHGDTDSQACSVANGVTTNDGDPVENGLSSAADNGDDGDFPALVLCCGSGSSTSMLKKDGSSLFVGGCMDGGVSMLSLGKLLAGIDSYSEFVRLAENGSEAGLSTMAQERNSATDGSSTFYNTMPDDIVVFSFGKALQDNFKLSEVGREDIARSLLEHFTTNLSIYTIWTAIANNCKAVYFCGGLFEHQIVRDVFSFHFHGMNYVTHRPPVKLRGLQLRSFLPVLGAVVDERS